MDQFALEAIKAWNQRQRPQYRLIEVTPINPSIGAEIGGVDLSREISSELFAEINSALVEYHVIVFRNQQLSNEHHKAFGRLFGELHCHPGRTHSDPEILVVAADETSKNVAGEGWHTDVTFEERPPMGSILYMTEVPRDGGGATMFLNSHLAYETLSTGMKQMLEGLTAIHSARKPFGSGYLGNLVKEPPGGWPEAEHPIVTRHPVSGRKLLYVNDGITDRIPRLSPHESDALLDALFRHCATMPELHCRVRWEPNTVTFWDNRSTQHHAVWDYYPARRYGQRVSIVGDRPESAGAVR
jgi:taurine dioxygenase